MSEPLETQPAGYAIAPWLSVRNGAEAVRFYKAAFGCEETHHVEDPAGAVVSRLSAGGIDIWISGESPENGVYVPESQAEERVRMLLIVPNPDMLFAQAIAAGARVIYPVTEGHGWRVGKIADPFGHYWEIGRPLEEK